MKTLLDHKQSPTSLTEWVSQATGIGTFGVKIRLQGNDLHILCEGRECPQRWQTLSDLLKALQQTDLDALTKKEQPSIYQVFVYGRKKGQKKPQWCHRVYLNQLDKHLEQVRQARLGKSRPKIKSPGALILSNESLARKGDPQAIARYLSETLSSLGVAVQVKVKQPQPQDESETEKNENNQRLWIFCQSAYSPDPSLIAQPVAQKLRSLNLTGYEDAVIAARVKGENKPDWLLRIDLTPAEVMLREWGRWGDLQAISKLLSEKLSPSKIKVQTSLKESTLHIFCSPLESSSTETAPNKKLCLHAITPLLEKLAPQGILSATVYGQIGEQQPQWIDWLTLPATEHLAFQPSALELAKTGDEAAITFLLERLLNPDLDLRINTGGIRVKLLRKQELLHIMCDSPVCPRRKQVAKPVAKLLQQLQIPGIAGVRIYGRRAGNNEPFWNYGVDFLQRQRFVPQATPEFAATAAYVEDLIPSEDTQEPLVRPDLTKEEVGSYVTTVVRHWGATVRKLLLDTQLFTETNQLSKSIPIEQGHWIAVIWGSLGLLIALQTDWVLGRLVTTIMPPKATISRISPPVNFSTSPSLTSKINSQSPQTTTFAQFPFSASPQQSPQQRVSTFNDSGFTSTSTPREKATATAVLLAARSQTPSFNSRQLDEQLALYKNRLETTGKPPDVLIIGSSRALRGIDPVALSRSLAVQGYGNRDVFNFGINGATVQVVDFIIRKVLEPSELPKLILWADGSRAFNSGRQDMTFEVIAASEGYQYVLKKLLANKTLDDSETENTTIKNNQGSSYSNFNKSFNETFASFSTTYQQRDNLKKIFNQTLNSLPLINQLSHPNKSTKNLGVDHLNKEIELPAIDFDGFLPLSVRFNPTNYYQKHSKVAGSYDSDYQNFQLGGEQEAALKALLRFTQSREIPLVFVNMPLTAEYLDSVRTKHEQEFQQYMLQMSTQPNFIYRDLSLLWPKANDYFSDPSHLNRYGAYEVSKKLANDPMIPWSSN
ncbi:MAG: DUF1574 family protein [Nostocaceae cyanobacterium]|nr:DUF1574 family protein [Nostocaceae cyanobacterium]